MTGLTRPYSRSHPMPASCSSGTPTPAPTISSEVCPATTSSAASKPPTDAALARRMATTTATPRVSPATVTRPRTGSRSMPRTMNWPKSVNRLAPSTGRHARHVRLTDPRDARARHALLFNAVPQPKHAIGGGGEGRVVGGQQHCDAGLAIQLP